jgi:23S rRNA pseudouridine2604 synthase
MKDVTLNGVVPELGTKVSPHDEVRIDGKLVREKKKPIYLVYKPSN